MNRYRIYAMDTHFFGPMGQVPFPERCEILRELGYDATYHTVWSEEAWRQLDLLADVPARYGLEVAGIYIALDIANRADAIRQFRRLAERVPPGSKIELALHCSDKAVAPSAPEGLPMAEALVAEALAIAEAHSLRVGLYIHINFWMERLGDALSLRDRIGDPALRIVFCGYHWFCRDPRGAKELLARAAPHLQAVNLCGSTAPQPYGLPDGRHTIEPLDAGSLNNFHLLALLRKLGYAGMVGFQGYGIGGDAYAALRRSLAAFREMEERLDRHPGWGELV